MRPRMQILAISGSLRTASANTSLLQAAALLAPEDAQVTLYGGLAALPPFNPDWDEEPAPPPVADLRRQLQASNAVLISSPEYAHGVPGTLKNALDWLVGSGELVGKPVALINASPRSTYALASLTETLTVMTARLVAEASITLPLQGKKMDAAGIAVDPDFSQALHTALLALTRAVRNGES